MVLRFKLLVLLSLLAVAGCSGGGGGSDAPPTPKEEPTPPAPEPEPKKPEYTGDECTPADDSGCVDGFYAYRIFVTKERFTGTDFLGHEHKCNDLLDDAGVNWRRQDVSTTFAAALSSTLSRFDCDVGGCDISFGAMRNKLMGNTYVGTVNPDNPFTMLELLVTTGGERFDRGFAQFAADGSEEAPELATGVADLLENLSTLGQRLNRHADGEEIDLTESLPVWMGMVLGDDGTIQNPSTVEWGKYECSGWGVEDVKNNDTNARIGLVGEDNWLPNPTNKNDSEFLRACNGTDLDKAHLVCIEIPFPQQINQKN